MDIDNLYNITARWEDHVNPTLDGDVSKRIIFSYVIQIMSKNLIDGIIDWMRCPEGVSHPLPSIYDGLEWSYAIHPSLMVHVLL